MKLRNILLSLILAVFASVAASAQGLHYTGQVLGQQAVAASYAMVAVCPAGTTGPPYPCTNPVTVYSNESLTAKKDNPMRADSEARFDFWVTAGHYVLEEYGALQPPRYEDIYVYSGGGGKSTSVQVNGSNTKSTANFSDSSTLTFAKTDSGNTSTVTAAVQSAPQLSGSLTQCSGTDFAKGISANGDASGCATPAGTAYSGTSPIVVSGSDISCPTCSTGSSTPTGQSNMVYAAPIQVPGSPIVFRPDPNISVSQTDDPISTYTPTNPIQSGSIYVLTFVNQYGNSSCLSASIPDSLGLTWANDATASNAEGRYVFTTTASVSGNDVITIPSVCQATGTNSGGTMISLMEVTGASAIQVSLAYGPDTCGYAGTPCTGSLTTTAGGTAIMSMMYTTLNGYYGPISVAPSGVNALPPSSGSPSWHLSLYGEEYSGTYGFTSTCAGAHSSAGYCGGFLMAFTPTLPSDGTPTEYAVATSFSGATISYASASTAGNTLLIYLWKNGGTGFTSACTASDDLGNTSGAMWRPSTFSGFVTMHLTTGGASSTITLSASCPSDEGGEALVYQLSGNQAVSLLEGSASASITYSGHSSVKNGYLLLVAVQSVLGSWTAPTITPSMTDVANVTTAPAYMMAISAISPGQSFSYYLYDSSPTVSGMLIIQPVDAPVYPMEPRNTVSTDSADPNAVVNVSSSSSTPVFDGSQGNNFKLTLSQDVTPKIVGLMDGQHYNFLICENSTGFWNFNAPANTGSNGYTPFYNLWPHIDPAPIACTPFSGTYDGVSVTIHFDQYVTADAGWCNSVAAPSDCSDASQGYLVMPLTDTSNVVSTTATPSDGPISVAEDSSIGTPLGVTCNTTVLGSAPQITARTSGTSFTVGTPTAPTTDPACYTFHITPATGVPDARQADQPPTTSGLTTYFDANVFTGLANGASVPVIKGLSANNLNATPASTTATFGTNAINSRSAWTFSGTSYNFTTTPATVTAVTIVVVFEETDTSTVSYLCGGGIQLVANHVSGALSLAVPGNWVGSSTAVMTAGNWYAAVVTYDPVGGAYDFKINGVDEGSGTSVHSSETGFDSFGSFPVALEAFYDRVLSSDEITATIAWLNSRYGL